MKKKLSDPLLTVVEGQLHDSKAENIIKIDLSGTNSICEFMYVVSGNSNRHVRSIADHLEVALKKIGISDLAIEGTENCQWVLIDTGDVIINIFQPEARQHYRLEELWQKRRK